MNPSFGETLIIQGKQIFYCFSKTIEMALMTKHVKSKEQKTAEDKVIGQTFYHVAYG